MALSWPLSLAEFFDTLPVRRVTFRLGRNSSFSQTGGGEIIDHALGTRLWQGEIQLDVDHHSVWAAIEARLALLEEPGASFLIRDPRLPGPMSDPDGSELANYPAKIGSLNSNNRELALKGLPPGFSLSQGDLIGFTYGTNPTRHALHRVVSGAAANGLGTTPEFEVTPYIRPGASLDTQVDLVGPVCKAKIISAEYGGSRATVSDGATLQWMQTLR